MQLIYIRAADPTSNKVAIWDRSPDHPPTERQEAGQIFISNPDQNTYLVAESPGVLEAIESGRILRVSPEAAREQPALADKK